MKKIWFATSNSKKFLTVKTAMKKFGIEAFQVPLDLPEPRSDDVRAIAGEKVLFAYEKIRKPVIAMDAGFFISSLNGFPKAFVNFALGTIGIDGILKLVEGKKRQAEFRECLAYLDGKISRPKFFESKAGGTLTKAERGKMKSIDWSPLSLIFIPKGEIKTLAEMSENEYKRWRAKKYKNSWEVRFVRWFSKRKRF